mgnify:CR=1 FL=1
MLSEIGQNTLLNALMGVCGIDYIDQDRFLNPQILMTAAEQIIRSRATEADKDAADEMIKAMHCAESDLKSWIREIQLYAPGHPELWKVCAFFLERLLRGEVDEPPHDSFSEAVVVTFDPEIIPLKILIDVHLRTHSSTSHHKMRGKYRSAVYVFAHDQAKAVQQHINAAQGDFDEPIVTMTLPFVGFDPSPERFQRYYETNAGKPFCTTYIDPKLSEIRRFFGQYSVQK